jgi:hypothetical protein
MKYKELAYKITGFSCPIFGVSWDPPKPEIKTARRIITFLEDRRVLYNPYELEMPDHCYESVIEIRKFLTEQLYETDRESELGKIIRGMRAACRKFLDSTQKSPYRKKFKGSIEQNLSMGMTMEFYSGIGEYRGTMGILIGKLLVMFGLDCESELSKIIPIEEDFDEKDK